MDTISLAQICDEIIEYYNQLAPKIPQVDTGYTIKNLDGTKTYYVSMTPTEALIHFDNPFRLYESADQMETDNETIRRYMTRHFAYLMKQVLYLDMHNFKLKGKRGAYFIYKKDSAVIKEILLRSVSQHEFDRIIGEWLNGKIRDDDYHAICELSERLFSLIRNIDGIDAQTANQWITALQIALKSYMAYAMVEAESNLRSLFSSSLPFAPKGAIFHAGHIYHEQIARELDAELNYLCKNAEDNILQALYQYLSTVDFEKVKSPTAFPPIELLQLKSVCEHLYDRDLIKQELPNANIVDTATQYFISVDSTYEKKLKARKQKDHKRHQRNKQKK